MAESYGLAGLKDPDVRGMGLVSRRGGLFCTFNACPLSGGSHLREGTGPDSKYSGFETEASNSTEKNKHGCA